MLLPGSVHRTDPDIRYALAGRLRRRKHPFFVHPRRRQGFPPSSMPSGTKRLLKVSRANGRIKYTRRASVSKFRPFERSIRISWVYIRRRTLRHIQPMNTLPEGRIRQLPSKGEETGGGELPHDGIVTACGRSEKGYVRVVPRNRNGPLSSSRNLRKLAIGFAILACTALVSMLA
jgi:hypothetical protein